MPLPYGRLFHPRPALTNCMPCIMQHWYCHRVHTRHNTNRKHNIHHIPYTNKQHTSSLQGYKNTIFKNGYYTTNIPTDAHTVNNKILRISPPRIISSEEILPRLTCCTLAQPEQINLPFSTHTYTTLTLNHIHNPIPPL